MSRIIGCRDLHIAELVTDSLSGGTPTYKTPIRIPSLVGVSISDAIEQGKFYSDDTVEQTFSKTSSKEVTIELGYLTNEVEALLTGKTVDSKGVLVQKDVDTPKEVALMFRAPKSKGGAFRYVCLFKGTLIKGESEFATQEDSIDPSNITLTGTFIPLLCNSSLSAVADSDDDIAAEAAENWFTSVYGSTKTTPAATK